MKPSTLMLLTLAVDSAVHCAVDGYQGVPVLEGYFITRSKLVDDRVVLGKYLTALQADGK